MKKPMLTLILVVLGLAFARSSPLAGDDRDPAMERLQALAVALQTRPCWSAAYRQEYVPPGMAMGEVVEGRVWVAWPDKALFASGDPVDQWMGLSGRLVRLIDGENASCDDHNLTAEEWERIPLIAILDERAATSRFSIVAEGDHGLVLIPREPGGVDRVEITTGDDGLPTTVVVKDPQGATNTFSFDNWEAADGPPKGQWLPDPPAGIECVGDVQ